MENLKLTSVRLSKFTLAIANGLGRKCGYGYTSNILRLAIWVGLKVIKPGVIFNLMHMMWLEEEEGKEVTLEDVLRAAGVELENLKNLE